MPKLIKHEVINHYAAIAERKSTKPVLFKQTESDWTRRLCKQMEEYNALVLSLVGGRIQQAGVPDRFVSHRVLFTGWLEFKGPRTRIMEHQAVMLNRLNHGQPYSAFIVRANAERGEPGGWIQYAPPSEPGFSKGEPGGFMNKKQIRSFTFDGTGLGLLRALYVLPNLIDPERELVI